MADDIQDAKAQKLAAARKKLKEYQQQRNNGTASAIAPDNTSSTVSIASNLSERSESESNLNMNGGQQLATMHNTTSDVVAAQTLPTAAIYFTHVDSEPTHNGETAAMASSMHTLQVLIAEKAQLTTEITKCRQLNRERELELEEVRVQYNSCNQRFEQLQQHCQEQRHSYEQEQQKNAELQVKLAQLEAKIADQEVYVTELKTQLKQSDLTLNELTEQHKQKCNELDMSRLRVQQLSDESNTVNNDNRVESLTQTQYMYEQQIRDLQAMVAQLTQDKEQANTQYQNYVQHQSSEITKLNERNAELGEETAQLQERERQLVEHISSLERDIQKNLNLQAQFKEANKPSPDESAVNVALRTEIAQLKERLNDTDFERHEFQLKIKSQHDQLQQKNETIEELQKEMVMLQTEQPDQVKLLATMESDKVAASRALTQNVEMKQQLDELELRFVQLTNDKAELVNRLDAEEFANREMRNNYAAMEQKLQANEERFKFKDEEMIRLSHENVELARSQLVLQQQLDRLQHYEAKSHGNSEQEPHSETTIAPTEDQTVTQAADSAIEATEVHEHEHNHSCEDSHAVAMPITGPQLPTAEAVEKLQARFTQLISKVADLTEEKHSLEHLVLQLQGETETIGEYITLYQTQRRMLKQREYEKAAQMRLLQAEREQLRDKINMLNNLVGSLGVELPQHQQLLRDRLAPASAEATTTDATQNDKTNEEAMPTEETAPTDSQEILHKIQDIITEIKENTEQLPTVPGTQHTGDHLNCCLGKFEVV